MALVIIISIYFKESAKLMKQTKHYLKLLCEKGLIHILSGSFLTKIVGFFGSIFIVRVLSKQEYGILGYLENMYSYVFIIAGMGLSNAILRFVILGKDINEKYSYFQYTVRKGFLWNILLALMAGTVFLFYPHPETYQGYIWLILVLLLALPFQYLTDNTLCNERAMFANQRYAVLAFILSASIIVSKIISGYLGGLYAVVICQALVYVVLGIAFLYNTGRKYYINASANTLQRIEKKKINSYSLQYMITNGLWAIFMLNDTFLLGRFCTPEVIADYRVAYTIPGSISIISSAIGIYVAPYFVQHENDRSWIQKNFKRAYGITAFVVGGLCIAIAVLSKPIIWLLYGETYLNVIGVMRILLLAAFFNCGLRFTTANILAAMGKVKYNMAVSIIGMAAQLLINFQIIPIYGAVGVALTSCIVYGIMAVCLLAVFVKQYYLKE